MKKKHTAQLRAHVASTPRISVSAFSHLRALLALVVCIAAACSVLAGALLPVFRPETGVKVSHPAAAGLTFADRVAYQRAIEEVYWRHRIWPKENSKPKPSLDEVMWAQQIEKKVEDYLRDAQAVEDYWQRPITPDQLQAEMERMARNTKQPAVLRELFEALGDDPFVIAECLARPVLSKRLVSSLDAKQIKAGVLKPTVMAAATANYTLPAITDGANGCTDDTWASMATAPSGRYSHTAVWSGSEMIVWGGGDPGYTNTGGRYNPGTDSWTTTNTTNAPSGRWEHAAVWSGNEMIVWGGTDSPTYFFNTGGRYNAGMDGWTPTSTTNAPAGRPAHTAVWTGSEVIVWGGGDPNPVNTGGRYCVAAPSPTPTPTPTASPCASVGAWTEQAPYPIAVFWNAVASQGGNVYSFGGIATNIA